MFVLSLSKIIIVWQKSLRSPLSFLHCFVFGCLNWQGVCFRSSGTVHTLPETRLSVCAMNTAHEQVLQCFKKILIV